MTQTRFTAVLVVAAVVALSGARLLQAQDKLPLLDTQKVMMENQFVRVIEVRVPAGVAEAMHSHGRGVTVALTDYDNETRTAGGQWSKSHTKFGEVKWAAGPVTHEARNTGTTAQHVIRIELK
jgi:D-alanyl-D-alanine dipeptidase